MSAVVTRQPVEEELPPAVVRAAAELAADLHDFHRRTVVEGAELGRRLIGLREQLGYGRFVGWLEQDLGVAKSSAYRFIQLAENLAPDSLPTVGKLGLTTAYQLSAKTTPAPLRQDIERRLIAGEAITGPAVATLIQEARAREQMARDEARLTEKERKRRKVQRTRQEKDSERERLKVEREEREATQAADDAIAMIVDRFGAHDTGHLADLIERAWYMFSAARLREAARR